MPLLTQIYTTVNLKQINQPIQSRGVEKRITLPQ